MKKKIVVSVDKKQKTRNDWGKVKPYTRIEPVKTKYTRKKKHKDELDG